MTKKMQIRNSTADFLVFAKENNSADTIEVRVQDGNVWLTQKAIGQLFDIDRSVVTKHLQNVFADGELVESSTCANFAQVAKMLETRNKMPAASVYLLENPYFLQFLLPIRQLIETEIMPHETRQ